MLEVTKQLRLSDACTIQAGYAFPSGLMSAEPSKYQVVKMANVYGGSLDLTRSPSYFGGDVEALERFKIRSEDILISLTGTVGKRDFGFCVLVQEPNDLLLNQRLCLLRVNREIVDPVYLLNYLKHPIFLDRFFAESIGGTGNQTNVSIRQLASIQLNLPPLPEQRRIAEILRTWDEAIEKLETLRAAKERRRKGILQYLLGIDRPFPKHWEIKPLDKIVERVRRTNDGGDHPVMTISAKSGFLMQSDKFARDMAGSSVDRYTLLREGEFAYNKGNSKTAPYGCIFPLDRPTAVIPFVYFCFKLDESLHHPFYTHLFAAGALHHQLSRLINSGVRNDGLLNLYADDFFSCEVPVPPLAEQERIARAITAANDEIALIDTEITALQRQKRGLMQKLLTGEWRVSKEVLD